MRRMAVRAVAALLCAGAALAQAQRNDSTTTVTHQLRTKQGSTFLGRLLSTSGDTLRFETNGGVLMLRQDMVTEVRVIRPENWHNGEYWFPDPHTTRLFFAPTGRMLAPHEGYYSNTYLFLNTLNAGVNSRLSLGGSTTLFPGTSQQLAWFTPKVGLVAREDFNLAVGGLFGYFGAADPGDRSFGLLYGVSTFGGVDASVTTGLGWGYAGGRLSASPAAMLGGSARVSQRAALITENYKFPNDDNVLFGYGIRFFGEKLSVDLALFNYTDDLVFPGFPFVSFAVKF